MTGDANKRAVRPSRTLGSTYVRHCRIQPSPPLERRADAGRAGAARRDRRARRRRRRLRLPRAGRRPTRRSSSSARRPRSSSSASRCPTRPNQLLVHVRDYTKGHPSIAANNHPVRHGPVVGIHNGIIVNDDELLAPHSCARAEPRMTVDSEAIFAIAAHSRNDARALEQLRGSMATAWLDEREPGVVLRRPRQSAGRSGSARAATGVFFASTKLALEVARALLRRAAAQARAARGHARLALRDGEVVERERFRPAARTSRTTRCPPCAPRGARVLPRRGSRVARRAL